MPKFRKKPVVIEAVQFNPEAKHWYDIEFPEGVRHTNYAEVSDLCGGTSGCSKTPEMWTWSVCGVVDTLEGKHLALPGDWIIKGVKGEFYPCKPDIFELTYEEVI
jgi:hypothetical protein